MIRSMTTSDETHKPPPSLKQELKKEFHLRWGHILWRETLVGLAFFVFSLTLGGLAAARVQIYQSWTESLRSFHWLVLVKGSQLQIDEVGRFLNQLDNVKDVEFISPEVMQNELETDPLLSRDFKNIDPGAIPPCFRIGLEIEALNPRRLDDLGTEIRTFPAVLDVAFDQKTLDSMHRFRMHWAGLGLLFNLIFFVVAALALICLGRFLFFTSLSNFHVKTMVYFILHSSWFWTLGFFSVRAAFGPISSVWLWGGFLLGVFRTFWRGGNATSHR